MIPIALCSHFEVKRRGPVIKTEPFLYDVKNTKSKRVYFDPLLLIAAISDTMPVNNAPRTLNATPAIFKAYNHINITPFS
jgi:hypothetical protein